MKLSNRVTTINGTQTTGDGWSILYTARDRLAKGEDITMLCIGDHDTPTPEAIRTAVKTSLDAGNTKYAEINGAQPLRAAIAERVQSRTAVPTTADNVFVTNGGQGALFSAMMGVLDPGDACTIIDPYYATYIQTVRAASGTPRIVKAAPADGFQLAREPLLEATQGARALLINTPNNPTGAVYSDDTLAHIREACLTNDLWLITDEVYDGQVHDGAHTSPRQLPDMAERTLVVGSLSKSHVMTGFRIGWLIGPESFIAPMTDLTNATTYGLPGFLQDAARTALEQHSAEAATSALYTRRRNAALKALDGTNAVTVSPPQGAMYLMLGIRQTGLSGIAFCEKLLAEEAIACMPGESFGQAAAGHIRVALTVPEDTLVPALQRISAFAARITP